MIKETMRTETRTLIEELRFNPIKNAKQTTEVFMQNNKLKLQVKRRNYSAEELLDGKLQG